MADIGGGFLAFRHGQLCEGWRRHTWVWWCHTSFSMSDFWLSSIVRHQQHYL